MESGHSNGHISALASGVPTGRVRSHQPVRPVIPKTAELDNNCYVLIGGV
jgi:hypothetical protein